MRKTKAGKPFTLPDRIGQVAVRNHFANIYHRLELAYWRLDECLKDLAWPSGKKADHDKAIAKGDDARHDLKGAYSEVVALNHLLFPGEEKS